MFGKNRFKALSWFLLLGLCLQSIHGCGSQPPSPPQGLVTPVVPMPPRPTGRTIGIQAGHGNGDPGALSCDKTVHEADITIAVANKVADLLRSKGHRVDVFQGTDPRMRGYTADAFVALHCDFCAPGASGYKVSRYGGQAGTGLNGSGDASDRLVQAIWEEYGQATGLPRDTSPGHYTSDMLNYYALTMIRPSTPGAIIEMGWLSEDLDALVHRQDDLATGIANGILRFLEGRASPGGGGAAETATVLLLDVSGSMAEDWQGGIKLTSAQQAALSVLDMIEQESLIGGVSHRVAVASFNSFANLDLPLTTDYAQARQAIQALGPLGNTNMGAGLEESNRALQSALQAQKITILLSDGLANEGLSRDEILSGPVQAAVQAGTCIYTVGFGDPGQLDEDLLRRIAQAACGQYSYASTPYDLEKVYVEIRHRSLGTVIGQFSGQVRQGESTPPRSVQVPQGQGEMYLTTTYSGSRLEMILTDPRGRRVDANYPGVILATYIHMTYMIVSDPMPGLWQLAVYGAEVPEGTLDFDTVVSVRPRVGGDSSAAVLLSVFLLLLVIGGGFATVILYTQRSPRRGLAVVTARAGVQVLGQPGCWAGFRHGVLRIGREPTCELVLSDPRVSRVHAHILQTPQGYLLEDLSTNGTFVNGQRIARQLLRHSDRIQVGDTRLVFWEQQR